MNVVVDLNTVRPQIFNRSNFKGVWMRKGRKQAKFQRSGEAPRWVPVTEPWVVADVQETSQNFLLVDHIDQAQTPVDPTRVWRGLTKGEQLVWLADMPFGAVLAKDLRLQIHDGGSIYHSLIRAGSRLYPLSAGNPSQCSRWWVIPPATLA